MLFCFRTELENFLPTEKGRRPSNGALKLVETFTNLYKNMIDSPSMMWDIDQHDLLSPVGRPHLNPSPL